MRIPLNAFEYGRRGPSTNPPSTKDSLLCLRLHLSRCGRTSKGMEGKPRKSWNPGHTIEASALTWVEPSLQIKSARPGSDRMASLPPLWSHSFVSTAVGGTPTSAKPARDRGRGCCRSNLSGRGQREIRDPVFLRLAVKGMLAVVRAGGTERKGGGNFGEYDNPPEDSGC